MQLRKPIIFPTLLIPQSLDSQPFLLSAPTHLHNHKPHLPTISLSFHKPTSKTTTPKSTTSRICIPSEPGRESKEGPFSSSKSCNSLSKLKMATMVAIDPYVFWTLFASLLGFLLLSVLRRRNYGNATAKGEGKVKSSGENHISEECMKSSGDGECRPEYGSGTDIIIVGAGVAGAALAHTLGKVIKK